MQRCQSGSLTISPERGGFTGGAYSKSGGPAPLHPDRGWMWSSLRADGSRPPHLCHDVGPTVSCPPMPIHSKRMPLFIKRPLFVATRAGVASAR
jgi:hypothetical protein